MSADSSDLAKGYWAFQKFDALGRKIQSGIRSGIGTVNRATIQTAFDGMTTETYEETGTALLGYTNRSFPSAYAPVDSSIKMVMYYDDYLQIDTTGYGFKNAKAFHTLGLSKGLMTGQLTRNLKTKAWQKRIMYYDYRGKLIQDFYLSNRGNIIRKDHQYRFNGELLKTRIEKKNSANVVLSTKILTYEQDHLGRKVSFLHNGRPIVKYLYDAIGRLQTKKFSPSGTTQGSKQTGNWTDASSWLSGVLPTLSDNVTINTGQILTIPSGEKVYAGTLNDRGTLRNFGTLNMGKATTTDLYSLNYKYHIRQGLSGINTDANNDLTNTLFSYRLDYENDSVLYDGNIRNQYWKSNIDGIKRAYEYSYDGDSRITGANYGSEKTGENYALSGITYDFNGNIKTLSRSGVTNTNFTAFGNVDNLTYTYQSNSNKLTKIADATTGNADLGDFRDGINTGDDYEYWEDGSLKKDKNKKIASITYNYLKLPEIITFDDAKTITTEYDAGGTKLKKIVSGGETTDYEEDDIYVNGVLYQTSHDEGRIVNGNYEYNITDHNNDLRVAFRDSLGIAVPTQSIFYDPWGLSTKGMQITRNPTNFNKYQFLNRETQFETGLVDLMRRQYDPQIGRFLSPDPVIEGQEHLSLYQYGWNNPVLKSDPNGLKPGEYFNEKGEKIGDDGKKDNKIFVIKTTRSVSDVNPNGTTGVATTNPISSESAIETESKIKEGNFTGDHMKNLVQLESRGNISKMFDIVSKDDGSGGSNPANNREYGGTISKNGDIKESKPGKVSDLATANTASINHVTNKDTKSIFHSHPSNVLTTILPNNRINKKMFEQAPSNTDINGSGNRKVNYEFGMRAQSIFIYNKTGITATIPFSTFKNP